MFDRRNRARRALASAVVVGGVAGVLLGLLELGLLRWVDAGAATLIGGVPALLLPLLGPCVLVGLVVGLIQGLGWWGVQVGAERLASSRAQREALHSQLGALLVAPLAVWAAIAAFEGRLARTFQLRPLWIVLVALGLTAGAWVAIRTVRWVAARAGSDARRSRLVLFGLALGLIALAVAALWLDRRLFVRRYPVVHVGLEAIALGALELAVIAGARAVHAAARRIAVVAAPEWALALVLVGASVGALGLAKVRRPDRQALRGVLYEKSPLGARLLDGVRGLGLTAPVAAVVASGPIRSAAGPSTVRAPGHDVVLITIDALRADHLGAWGYPRATSPRLDALAAEGARFERAYAPVPHTSFSLASVLLGKHAYALDQLGLLGADAARHETLSQVVRRYGYHSGGFFPPAVFYVDGGHFKGFEASRYGFEYVRYEPFKEHEDAPARTDQVLAYLASAQPERVLLWVHYFGPHEPYVPHPELGAAAAFGSRAIDLYDGEIRWVDGEVGRLVDGIRATRPGAIVIVTADHGEEFGEHGGAYHGTTLFDEQLRVPLIIVGPGIVPRRIAAPVSTIDVVPTVLGLLDVPASSRVTGTDLGPWLGAVSAPESVLPPVPAAIEDLKMIASGREKLICDTARDYCRLYDLVDDPGESIDVAAQRPERVAALRAALETWLAGVGTAETGATDPLGTRRGAVERAALGDRTAWPEAAQVIADRAVDAEARRRTAATLARGIAALAPDVAVDPRVRSALAAARGQGDAGGGSRGLAERGAEGPLIDGWCDLALAALGDVDARARVGAAPATSWTALALARGREAESVDVLEAALTRTVEVDEQRLLLAALGRSRDLRALNALTTSYGEVRTRRYAAGALGALGRPEATAFLIARLADEPYTTVRAVVAVALGRLGDPLARPALEAALAKDADAQVTAAAAHALAALGAGTPVTPGARLRAPSGARTAWVVLGPSGTAEAIVHGTGARHVPLVRPPGALSDALPVPLDGARDLELRGDAHRVLWR